MASSSGGVAASSFCPPDRYGLIEPGLYRSAFPSPDSFGHLRLLGLRTVVNLSQEALTRAAAGFLAENNILLADVGLQVWTHPKCDDISHELIKEAMGFVLDNKYHPLLVVSASGTHQVGALVGCLRRLQHWSLSATLAEYRLYAAPSPRLGVEQFVELWDCDLLTLPDELPPWFVHQSELLEEDAERWAIGSSSTGGACGSGSWGGVGSSFQGHVSASFAFPGDPLGGATSERADADAAEVDVDAAMGGAALASEDEAAIEAIAGAHYYPSYASSSYFDVHGLLAPPGTKTSVIDPRDD
jgi:hypothetical protein